MQPTRQRKSSSRRTLVVTEIDLRALFMKVLQCQCFYRFHSSIVLTPCSLGFLERQGMHAIGSHVAFVSNPDIVSDPNSFSVSADNMHRLGP